MQYKYEKAKMVVKKEYTEFRPMKDKNYPSDFDNY